MGSGKRGFFVHPAVCVPVEERPGTALTAGKLQPGIRDIRHGAAGEEQRPAGEIQRPGAHHPLEGGSFPGLRHPPEERCHRGQCSALCASGIIYLQSWASGLLFRAK